MKKLIFIFLLSFSLSSWAQNTPEYSMRTRTWSNKGTDDGSIFPIGNGEILVYEKGPNIDYVFGPPYSAPSSPQIFLEDAKRTLKVESKREKNTAIWHHNVYMDDALIAQMVDYIIPDKGVFIREMDVKKELTFKVIAPLVNTLPLKNYFSYLKNVKANVVLIKTLKGTTFFCNDPISEEHSMFIVTTGNIEVPDSINGNYYLKIKPGKSRLILSGSTSIPKTVANTESILEKSESDLLSQSRKYWHDFSSRRLNFASMIPVGQPLRDTLLDAIDGVSTLIKCQQSTSGGVMAGHFYNMAYVRDQSGVLRGVLSLGYFPEAKAILNFWINKFNVFGNLVNAEGMGNNAARLFFVNDEVEVPAYIIQDCFEYYKYTKDNAFLKQAFPMMQWALDIQLKHLVEGMTEFSGDETYIAGGTLPVGIIYQGSAESTLLFITGGEKLLDWASKQGLWKGEKLENYRQKVAYARKKYKDNFMDAGILYANNPKREKLAGMPRFRFGYCEVHNGNQKSPYMTWTEKEPLGRYICADCMNKVLPVYTLNRDKRYILNSVNLIPLYIQSDLFTTKEIEGLVKPGIEIFKTKNAVPSNVEGNRSLGYDYGLFLYNMVKLNDPLKEKMLKKALSVLDPTGAWVEYYDNDKPYNCRSRPWESAINIEAVIEYIKSSYGNISLNNKLKHK